MLNTTLNRSQAAAIVRHFEDAVQAFAYQGARNPEAIPELTKRYMDRKKRLVERLIASGSSTGTKD